MTTESTKTIELEITVSGGIRMLHDDEFDMTEFGSREAISMCRASHVEWEPSGWYIDSAATGKRIASGFASRGAALAWERKYYGVGGEGWPEIERRKE
jgi:hypothetical protein